MAALALPLAISGLGALAGIFGNKPQKTTTDSTQKFNSSNNTSASTNPVYDPATQALRDSLTSKFTNLTNPDLSGYAAQGINQINNNSDIRTKALQNSLAARGLSYSPVASIAPALSQSQRIGDIGQFQNNLPLIQQQLMLQNLNAAGGYLKGLPIGSESQSAATTEGTQIGHSVQTGTGNQVAGGLSGLATSLAGLYGRGVFGRGASPNSSDYGTSYLNKP